MFVFVCMQLSVMSHLMLLCTVLYAAVSRDRTCRLLELLIINNQNLPYVGH